MTKQWDNSAPTEVLRFPAKELRAGPIRDYVIKAGYPGVVTFTCGHAAEALRRVLRPLDKHVLEVGARGVLQTEKWWTPAEIRAGFPHLFDATSGHLPVPLMYEIGRAFKSYFDYSVYRGQGGLDSEKQYVVPSGSGETIFCLHLAYPEVRLLAAYDNSKPETTRDTENVAMNALIDSLFPVQYWNGTL